MVANNCQANLKKFKLGTLVSMIFVREQIMYKIAIIYDSKTGNTETMAKAIADGAKSVKDVDVILSKLGETFSPTMLDDADAVILGSPSHHGHVTPEMLVFLADLNEAIDSGSLSVEGKIGLAFGSYGWDGGICIEKLSAEMTKLGFKMNQNVIAKAAPIQGSSLNAEFFKGCQEAGKNLAKKISMR
jgi:flavodoxin I